MSIVEHQQKVTVGYTVRDKAGRFVKRGKLPFHSFLTQYYNIVYSMMAHTYATGGIAINVNDTANVARSLGGATISSVSAFTTQALATDNTYGIQVGTGSTANSGTTFGLATLIANGSGASQLNYGSMGITVPVGTAPDAFTFTRTLTNNSGGTINITELGLVAKISTDGPWLFMITRDVFSSIPLLNGNNITFTLTLSYTIS